MHIKPSEIVAKQIAFLESNGSIQTGETSASQSDHDIPSLEGEDDNPTTQIKVGGIYNNYVK